MKKILFIPCLLVALVLTGCSGEKRDLTEVAALFPNDVPAFYYCELTDGEQKGSERLFYYDTCTVDALPAYREILEERSWITTHIRPRKKDYLRNQERSLKADNDGFELLVTNDKYAVELIRYASGRKQYARLRIIERMDEEL